jgi:hypothetical protein
MLLSDPLVLLAVLFAFFSLVFLVVAITLLVKKRYPAMARYFAAVVLLLFLSALFITISIANQGYHTLKGEELAATISVEPTGEHTFSARVLMPNGSEQVFPLEGDELSVDAYILKWSPPVNIFGPRTSYELARVTSRYTTTNDETTKVPAACQLSYEKPLSMYELRRRFGIFYLLLEAEQASAAFCITNSPEEFRVMVSPAGLAIRKIEKQPGP